MRTAYIVSAKTWRAQLTCIFCSTFVRASVVARLPLQCQCLFCCIAHASFMRNTKHACMHVESLLSVTCERTTMRPKCSVRVFYSSVGVVFYGWAHPRMRNRESGNPNEIIAQRNCSTIFHSIIVVSILICCRFLIPAFTSVRRKHPRSSVYLLCCWSSPLACPRSSYGSKSMGFTTQNNITEITTLFRSILCALEVKYSDCYHNQRWFWHRHGFHWQRLLSFREPLAANLPYAASLASNVNKESTQTLYVEPSINPSLLQSRSRLQSLVTNRILISTTKAREAWSSRWRDSPWMVLSGEKMLRSVDN